MLCSHDSLSKQELGQIGMVLFKVAVVSVVVNFVANLPIVQSVYWSCKQGDVINCLQLHYSCEPYPLCALSLFNLEVIHVHFSFRVTVQVYAVF